MGRDRDGKQVPRHCVSADAPPVTSFSESVCVCVLLSTLTLRCHHLILIGVGLRAGVSAGLSEID